MCRRLRATSGAAEITQDLFGLIEIDRIVDKPHALVFDCVEHERDRLLAGVGIEFNDHGGD
jgi:hypothetical protein